MYYTQMPRNRLRPKPEPKLRKSDTHKPPPGCKFGGLGFIGAARLQRQYFRQTPAHHMCSPIISRGKTRRNHAVKALSRSS